MAQKKEVKEELNSFEFDSQNPTLNDALIKIEEGKKLISEANNELMALMRQKPVLDKPTQDAYTNFDDRRLSFGKDAEMVEMMSKVNSAFKDISDKERQVLDLASENEGLKDEIERLNEIVAGVSEERKLMIAQLNEFKSHVMDSRKTLEEKEEAHNKRILALRTDNDEKISRLIKEQTEREVELKVRIQQMAGTLSQQKVFVEGKERMMKQLMNEVISAFHSIFPDSQISQFAVNLETQISSVQMPASPLPGEKGFVPRKEGLLNLDFDFKNPFQYNLTDGEEQVEISPMVDIALSQGDSFESIKYSLMSSGYKKRNVEKILKEKI